jgi:hypothetical protein
MGPLSLHEATLTAVVEVHALPKYSQACPHFNIGQTHDAPITKC